MSKIFDKNDKVDETVLPPELQGKTPAEIAAYYQRREQIILDRNRAKPPVKNVEDDKVDIFGDAAGSIRKIVNREVSEAEQRASQVMAPGVIASCRMIVREAHSDYGKFSAEIESRMSKMSQEAQMKPEYWEMTYKMVKGEQADAMIAAEGDRVRKEMNPVEKSTPAGQTPPEPRKLTEEEKVVADKFDMPHKKYQEAADRYEATNGALPFTTDSRKPRLRKKAS